MLIEDMNFDAGSASFRIEALVLSLLLAHGTTKDFEPILLKYRAIIVEDVIFRIPNRRWGSTWLFSNPDGFFVDGCGNRDVR